MGLPAPWTLPTSCAFGPFWADASFVGFPAAQRRASAAARASPTNTAPARCFLIVGLLSRADTPSLCHAAHARRCGVTANFERLTDPAGPKDWRGTSW